MQQETRKRILLVDDNLERGVLISRMLSDATYLTNTVPTGEECLKFLRRHSVDLVLMDVVLPGISGVETCRRLSMRARRTPPPVLLLSAIAVRSSDQAEGLEAGAIGYIAWPVSARELRARVSAALGTNRLPQKEKAPELSPRQLEVVAWIAAGLTTKEIAGKLGVAVRTAETHRAAILRRLEFRSSTLLVRYAIERGITPESLDQG